MKRTLLILLIILSYVLADAQPVVETSPRSITSLQQRVMIGRNFYMPKVSTVPVQRPSLTTAGGVDTIGAQVFCLLDSNLYVYTGGDRWVTFPNTTNIINGVDNSTRIISGAVVWDSLLIFHSIVYTYYIKGRFFTAPAANFTLAPAYPSNDRIDVFYVDTLGNIGVLKGDISGLKPQVNPLSQLEVAQVTIKATSLVPFGFANTEVYRENVEWATFLGSDYIHYISGTNQTFTDFTFLKLYIRLNSAPTTSGIYIALKAPDPMGYTTSQLLLQNGSFGLNTSIIGSYQPIAIPFSAFALTSSNLIFNRIEFYFPSRTIAGSLFDYTINPRTGLLSTYMPISTGGSIQLDDVILQEGGSGTGSSNGVLSVNTNTGPHVVFSVGDSLSYNVDTSLLNLIDKRTGTTLSSVPSLLSYMYSGDTCLIIDTINSRTFSFRLNPNCRGGGSGGSDSTTASNGLNLSGKNVKMGGALTENTTIPTGIYTLNLTSTTGAPLFISSASGFPAITAQSVNSKALEGYAAGSGVGVTGRSLSGLSGSFSIYPSSTNTVVENTRLSRYMLSGTAANGIGQSITFENETATNIAIANSIESKWTDATHATRTSEFSITGVNNAITADLLTISGNGATKLNKYGIGTFTGTPTYALQVDASGNIIEGTISGGGGSGWNLTGNAITAGSDFLGSTNNVSLRMRTNGIERMVVDSTGNVGIGTTAPTYKLHVTGDALIGSGSTSFKVDPTNNVISLQSDSTHFKNPTGIYRYDSVKPAVNVVNKSVLVYDTTTKRFERASMDQVVAGGGGSSGTTSEQSITATASQTAFTFTSVPASYNDYMVFINGGLWQSTTGYTTSGNIVTVTTPLDLGDIVTFRRTK